MRSRHYYQAKKAWIIGGSEGIGLAIAEQLVKSGAHVVISSRSDTKLSSALKQLRTKRDIQLRAPGEAPVLSSIAFDVTDYAATLQATETLIAIYGVPDFMINCAGIAYPGNIAELGIEQYRQMMDLNYFGLVHTAKAILPHFVNQGRGHIINTSSIAGFIGLFDYTGYCASKFATIGFSRALSQELEPFGIRVSVLCPPNTLTPGLERENLSKSPDLLRVEEKAGVATPEQIATALLRAIPSGRFMILPNLLTSAIYRITCFFPELAAKLTQRKKPATHN